MPDIKPMPNSPSLYVIAGPNGAGKTTFARTFLPHFANCREFVNADYIATGLSPFAPTTAAIEAGRLMLKRMREISSHRRSFAIETTSRGKATCACSVGSKRAATTSTCFIYGCRTFSSRYNACATEYGRAGTRFPRRISDAVLIAGSRTSSAPIGGCGIAGRLLTTRRPCLGSSP